MSRNTTRLSFRDWQDGMRIALGDGFKAILATIAVIMVIATVVGDWNHNSDSDKHDRQANIVRMFTDIKGTPVERTAARQELARDLLNVRKHGTPVEELKDATALRQVEQIAKTGEPPSITPYNRSFWDRAGLAILIGAGASSLFLSVVFGMLHFDAMRRVRGRHYRSDLPWLHGWPWLVPALAPWLVPALVIDYWRLRKQRRSELTVKLDPRRTSLTQD